MTPQIRQRSGEGDAGSERVEPVRILHAIDPGSIGGAETVVRTLAAAQNRTGHHATIGAAITNGQTPSEHPFVVAARDSGVDVRTVAAGGRAYVRELRFWRSLLAEVRPDVVHTHGYRADVLAGLAARGLALPRVSTVHGFTGGGRRNRLYEWIQGRALRQFDAVVCVAPGLVTRLRSAGIPEARIALVPNASFGEGELLSRESARRRFDLPSSAEVVGWVGRLSREKGPDVFLEALARLERPGAVALIVGEGREADALRSLAVRLGIASRIRWAGRIDRADRLFAAFDVFALSSRTEGTPMVLFEAMRAGVPIVATAVGGVPDVIPTEAGWQVPPEDPAAFATALCEALGHPEEAHRRAIKARSHAEDAFGSGAWVAALADVYREARAVMLADRRRYGV